MAQSSHPQGETEAQGGEGTGLAHAHIASSGPSKLKGALGDQRSHTHLLNTLSLYPHFTDRKTEAQRHERPRYSHRAREWRPWGPNPGQYNTEAEVLVRPSDSSPRQEIDLSAF